MTSASSAQHPHVAEQFHAWRKSPVTTMIIEARDAVTLRTPAELVLSAPLCDGHDVSFELSDVHFDVPEPERKGPS